MISDNTLLAATKCSLDTALLRLFIYLHLYPAQTQITIPVTIVPSKLGITIAKVNELSW